MKSLVFFKSLADETRIRLLNLLMKHELNVNEIVAIMDMGQSRISRHLKILTDSGLLMSRRDGLWVFYRAADKGEGEKLVHFFGDIIQDDKVLLQDLERLEEAMRASRDEKTRYFDTIARDWDSMKSSLLDDSSVAEEIVSSLGSCSVAADLGCGTGKLLPYLRSKADHVIGVDRSSQMLEQAREFLSEKDDGFELRIGEIEHLPMRDGEADAAVINMVLHHLPTPFEGIHEAGRIVKGGGSLIIVDLDKHENEEMRNRFGHRWLGFTRTAMESWVRAAGFEVRDFEQRTIKKGLVMNMFLAIKQ